MSGLLLITTRRRRRKRRRWSWGWRRNMGGWDVRHSRADSGWKRIWIEEVFEKRSSGLEIGAPSIFLNRLE